MHNPPSPRILKADKSAHCAEFLSKLVEMCRTESPDVIRWDYGRIVVDNPPFLCSHVLKKYFRHSRYTSFKRQLNYFGFKKVQGKGKMNPCVYANTELQGADVEELLRMKRKTKIFSKKTVSANGGGFHNIVNDISNTPDEEEEIATGAFCLAKTGSFTSSRGSFCDTKDQTGASFFSEEDFSSRAAEQQVNHCSQFIEAGIDFDAPTCFPLSYDSNELSVSDGYLDELDDDIWDDQDFLSAIF
uniref:HSF-type DNA-binding domain-containing protein n=1 Tax=Fibrocapsa japonica TaxID=94617 RepID=A0A6U1QEX2_9STRA|mmetsp:Transcript_8765/g.13486  ORF Transcript_8765/g.13486 Transcript_8765/m.13486 type:complete len:244 (+) Transcript_8765:88-819(+)